jgi:hypothetical protein
MGAFTLKVTLLAGAMGAIVGAGIAYLLAPQQIAVCNDEGGALAACAGFHLVWLTPLQGAGVGLVLGLLVSLVISQLVSHSRDAAAS